MKNFTEQLADIAKTLFKKDNEINFLNAELAKVKKVNAGLRLELCELKSNKKARIHNQSVFHTEVD